MTHISHVTLRQDRDRYLDEAASQGKPIVVELEHGKANVVLMSEVDFNSWRKTASLLSNPGNAERLCRGLLQAQGALAPHEPSSM
jgi:PHD/YefM family antitoxin component YafN of YafNO toxin-antitoxin module